MTSLFSDPVLQRLQDPAVNRLVIGLSGGVDSISLLHALVELDLDRPIVALHIDHGLQDDAENFAALCRSACEGHPVELTVVKVEVSLQGSLETNARHARYDAFEQFLVDGDLLLLAHHADDQVETILFRLFRGSRAFGLEGMPVERPIGRARLYRPFLSLPKELIAGYARAHELGWIDDPTNLGTQPDRNYLRHNVLPVIEQRWPGVKQNLMKALGNDMRARDTLFQRQLQVLDEMKLAFDCLDIAALRRCDIPELIDLLTVWFQASGAPLPSGRMLGDCASALVSMQPVNSITSQVELRQHDRGLYLLKPLPELDQGSFSLKEGETRVPGGVLANTLTKGVGLKPSVEYEVCYRQGGEKLRIRHSRSLKNLCQEHGIPEWLRDRIPLVFHGDEFVAVAALPDWGSPMLVADAWTVDSASQGYDVRLYLEDRFSAGQATTDQF